MAVRIRRLLQLPLAISLVSSCKKTEPAPTASSVTPIAPASPSRDDNAPRPAPTPEPPGSAELTSVPKDVVAKVKLERIAKGLARPVWFGVAPGDPSRFYVLLQHAGEIRVLKNGALEPKPFFKIADISTGNEQGLLGLAFHPKYAENHRLFVNYTDADDHTHIVEYKVAGDAVDPKSARELVKIPQPYSNHNGGHLAFGPDGKLYTGMGDGGAANDPQKNGQNPKALLGKILRFDVDALKPTPEIVHVGVRNPWRFAFDGNDLYIGDVGQNLWENVYVVANDKRHNFGWNIVEGNHCFDGKGAEAKSCDRSGFTPPVADYPHAQGCSVTGGLVYRGKALPALLGRYFYADYCTGLLRSFVWKQGAIRDHWDWKPTLDREANQQEVSSFGTDADGELYIVELTGAIYKLVPAS